MKPITLTDLDGVHFQRRRDCPMNLELTVATLDSEMQPSAYSTPKQAAFLQWLLSESDVVPVTARPVESFKRVLVDFKGYAICSFGGVILTPDGQPEPTWHEKILAESSSLSPTLVELKDEIDRRWSVDGTAVGVTVVRDAGCDLYINCKFLDAVQDAHMLTMLRGVLRTLLPEGWNLHSNGNNFALLPPFLSKQRAAYYFLSELAPPHSCVLGIGDSLSDVGFMTLCDYAVTPTNSQVFSLLKRL